MERVFNLSMKIKELPEAERPYEKLELYGEQNLSNAELLAIIIKSGTKEETSVQLAQRILKLNSGQDDTGLGFLRNVTLEELMQIKGIGRVKAIQLKAVGEIVTRMQKPSNYKKMKFTEQRKVAEMLLNEFRFEKREILRMYLLNHKNMVTKIVDIAKGGSNFVNASIPEILGQVLQERAPKILLVHNHPSGDSIPSRNDIEFTDKLYNAAKDFQIDLIDHIVIGDMEYTSIFNYVRDKIGQVQKKN